MGTTSHLDCDHSGAKHSLLSSALWWSQARFGFFAPIFFYARAKSMIDVVCSFVLNPKQMEKYFQMWELGYTFQN